MSAAGRALSRPELRTLHANGGVNTDMVGAALRLARKAAGWRSIPPSPEFVSICTIRCASSRKPLSNPRIAFETERRPVFLWPSQPEETIVNFPFGERNSTNAKNGSPLTDAK
ncbi:hypothetical protein EHI44_13520 [Rhizobium leguminosarum]|uniref:hypothetical protein n=1 Tax=Rhizobium leguminosarum TaxID=384 RepID=UPI000FEDF96C|nr:hypothetical protein [Rhizobium leguminosarum]RWY87148.1 hypothetical protein EHI44_13520 [Rhizobium leguminosarum]